MSFQHLPSDATKGREVAEASFAFLQIELINYLLAQGEDGVRKLDNIGYQMGIRLAERLTRDRPRFADNLEIIKFICKDLWSYLFRKQVDKLQTNHRGVFVLADSNFPWIGSFSSSASSDSVKEAAQDWLVFPCAIIRGALSSFGVPCTVQPDISALPRCWFTVRLTK
eukprot:GILI01025321.1.p1 GENE.GILI01025321.1~~GILI01025321.1.p1  ORF type:complete len:180 (-),score=11.45 GILI01025321.1:67-570(-)